MSQMCRTKDCPRLARTRGVCEACRQKLHILVKSGKTTWEKLEAEGLIAPKKSGKLPFYFLDGNVIGNHRKIDQ